MSGRAVTAPPKAMGWLHRRRHAADGLILVELGNTTPGAWRTASDLQSVTGLSDRRFRPAAARLAVTGLVEVRFDPADRASAQYRLPVVEAEQ